MKALTLSNPREVHWEDVADPEIVHPHDAIIQVLASAICGSDLHAYHGHMGPMTSKTPIGHEYVGVVKKTGADVSRFKAGDRVTGAFFSVCGRCAVCQRGHFTQCLEKALFGFGPRLGDLAGTQAEFARIPYADATLVPVPDGVCDEAALTVGDILSTAYFAVERAAIKAGDFVAVVGLGPVGQLAVELAFVKGAAAVAALDRVPDRLQRAEALGARPVVADDAAVKTVRALTGGHGADAVVEAVGSEEALALAVRLARGFATVSCAGVYNDAVSVSMPAVFAKDLTLRGGMANVPAVADTVMQLVREGRVHPEHLFSHRLPLSDGPRGYELFDQRLAAKILLIP